MYLYQPPLLLSCMPPRKSRMTSSRRYEALARSNPSLTSVPFRHLVDFRAVQTTQPPHLVKRFQHITMYVSHHICFFGSQKTPRDPVVLGGEGWACLVYPSHRMREDSATQGGPHGSITDEKVASRRGRISEFRSPSDFV